MKAFLRRRLTIEELRNALGKENTEMISRIYFGEYEEEGEIISNIDEEIPLKVARRLLSRKMTQLIELIKKEELSISEIAYKLNRSPSNIWKDLHLLAKYKIIDIEKYGKRVIPQLLVEEIIIKI